MKVIILLFSILIASIAFANEPVCNGRLEPPVIRHDLFPNSSMPVEVCYHNLDDYNIVVLVWVLNPNDNLYELIMAKTLVSYHSFLEDKDKDRDRE